MSAPDGLCGPGLSAWLAPRSGERVLEVGPGTGYYKVDVADWVSPGGRLDISDLGQEMLDHTLRRVGDRGLVNITATHARQLPYRSGTFRRAENNGLMVGRRSGTRLGGFARVDRTAASRPEEPEPR
jgi:hypothetical protein